ncbi:hypothetical protein BJ742DRAFT_123547 [Cladochytrium replicatum]|nr:hypothetical protein BJ742DRAFT_123547 [Cladochytrium replicatum]
MDSHNQPGRHSVSDPAVRSSFQQQQQQHEYYYTDSATYDPWSSSTMGRSSRGRMYSSNDDPSSIHNRGRRSVSHELCDECRRVGNLDCEHSMYDDGRRSRSRGPPEDDVVPSRRSMSRGPPEEMKVSEGPIICSGRVKRRHYGLWWECHLFLCHARTMADVRILWEELFRKKPADTIDSVDRKTGAVLGDMSKASIVGTPFLILISESKRIDSVVMLRLIDLTGFMDESSTNRPCQFSLVFSRTPFMVKFKVSTSVEYQEWMDGLDRAARRLPSDKAVANTAFLALTNKRPPEKQAFVAHGTVQLGEEEAPPIDEVVPPGSHQWAADSRRGQYGSGGDSVYGDGRRSMSAPVVQPIMMMPSYGSQPLSAPILTTSTSMDPAEQDSEHLRAYMSSSRGQTSSPGYMYIASPAPQHPHDPYSMFQRSQSWGYIAPMDPQVPATSPTMLPANQAPVRGSMIDSDAGTRVSTNTAGSSSASWRRRSAATSTTIVAYPDPPTTPVQKPQGKDKHASLLSDSTDTMVLTPESSVKRMVEEKMAAAGFTDDIRDENAAPKSKTVKKFVIGGAGSPPTATKKSAKEAARHGRISVGEDIYRRG